MKKLTRILSFALVMLMLVATLASCSGKINLAEKDMGKYIKMGDYNNIALTLPSGYDYDGYMKDMLFQYRDYKSHEKNDDNKTMQFIKGDVLAVWYRLTGVEETAGAGDFAPYDGTLDGYTYNQSGSKVNIKGDNMYSTVSSTVFLGSGTVCKALEDELIGKSFGDFYETEHEAKVEGAVAENDIVYISYAKTVSMAGIPQTDESKTVSYERYDLASDPLGIKSKLVGKNIGDTFTHKITEKVDSVNDPSVKVDKASSYTITVNSVVTKERAVTVEVLFDDDIYKDNEKLYDKKGQFEIVLDEYYLNNKADGIVDGDLVYTNYRAVIIALADKYKEDYSSYIGTMFDSTYGVPPLAVAVGGGTYLEDFEDGFIGKGSVGTLAKVDTTSKIKDLFDANAFKNMYAAISLQASYKNGDSTVAILDGRQYFAALDGSLEEGQEDNYIKTLQDIVVGEATGDDATVRQTLLDKIVTHMKNSEKALGQTMADTFKITIGGAETEVSFSGAITYAIDGQSFEENYDASKGYIDVVFPEDYVDESSGTATNAYLNGATGRFYIVIDHYIPCTIKAESEIDADYITNTLGYKTESGKTGADLVAEYKQAMRDYVAELALATDIENASESIWKALSDMTEVKKYPKGNLKAEVEAIMASYQQTYDYYKQQYSTSFTYTDVYAYLIAELKSTTFNGEAIDTKKKVDAYIEDMAKSTLKEKMILYYMVDKLEIPMSGEEYDKARTEFIEYMAAYYQTTADSIVESYGEEQIQLQILNNFVMEKVYELNKGNVTRKD